jgi:D-alanyl-D-alanine carboxypeptidase
MLTAWCTKTEKTEENQKQNAKYDYLVLVNKQHKLPEDWEANVELVETKNAFGETIKVEKEALKKYNELRDALLEEGVDIELDSAYRSVSRQEELWKEFEEEYWIDYTQKYVAVPWYSEHHTALAIDICIKKDWELIYDNDEMTEEREIFAKVHEKLADYWFILRYLEGKDDITWYGYEPWHLRYIRDVDVAKEIMEKWLTLEEYLGEVNE